MKEKPVILIIDADLLQCSLMSTMLYTLNVKVACAHSIAEADKLLQDTSPSLVFVDNLLPDGKGIDYISRLKKDSKTEVVVISDSDDELLEQLALSKGCLGFLQTPFSYRRVSDLLDKALKHHAGWYNTIKRRYERLHLLRSKK